MDDDSNAMGVAFHHIGWIMTSIFFTLYWLKFVEGQLYTSSVVTTIWIMSFKMLSLVNSQYF